MSEDDDDSERRRFTEYECPECAAHNPVDDGFHAGDTLQCFYCGMLFVAALRDGKLVFKPA